MRKRHFASLHTWESAGDVPVYRSADPTCVRLLEAITRQDRLYVYYMGGSEPGASRWIKPRRLFKKLGYTETYVRAYCEKRCEDRTFRIDRLHFLDPPAVRPGAEAVARRFDSGRSGGGLPPPIERAVNRVPQSLAPPVRGGGCLLLILAAVACAIVAACGIIG